jgi:hypothetical protein
VNNPFKGDEPCTQVDPGMFDMDHSTTRWEVAALRKVCEPCIVREACRDYAIENALPGFWGGMTAADRKRLKQSRRRETSNVS